MTPTEKIMGIDVPWIKSDEAALEGAFMEIEPSADLRMYASALRQMFVALVAEGFTEPQALVIIGHTLKENLGGDNG